MLFYSKFEWVFVFLLIAVFLSLLVTGKYYQKPDIESSLQYLFSGDLGHTLVGAKPVSSEEWFWCRSVTSQSKEDVVNFLKKNFNNSETFILHVSSPNPSLLDITLIHKPLLEKTINREKYLKNFIESRYTTVNNFLQKFQSSQDGIFARLHYDDRALGLAFGYGDVNSSYASRRMEIQDSLCYRDGFCGYMLNPMPHPWAVIRFCRLPLPWIELPLYGIKPSTGFRSIEQELEYLNSLECKTQNFGPPYFVTSPVFIARQCPETDRLIRHYKKSTNRLAQIYLKKTFSQFLIEQSHTKQ
jgi:hypothetical protein